jgi:hypothetical protein
MSQTVDFVPVSQLVVRDPDARRLAEELSGMTGDGLDIAVVTALHEAIERQRSRAAFHDRIMAITRDIAGASRIAFGEPGQPARD